MARPSPEGKADCCAICLTEYAGGDELVRVVPDVPALPGKLLREACGGHLFIVGFHGLVRDPATADLSLVMQGVDGPSLHDYLRLQRRGQPEATARAAMWQLLTGAKGMHESNIVHRDMNPGNILVGDGHRILKICDFELAKYMSEAPPYEPAGTLAYKAPEMLLVLRDSDARVDACSLGCIMAEIIYGRPLFAGSYGREQLGVPDGKTCRGSRPRRLPSMCVLEGSTKPIQLGSRVYFAGELLLTSNAPAAPP
ncbi:putative cyclin-dependent kinase F-2 [Setaria viridis]|uniref:putative cyclin-dependent kinase F-2 n=1 Tax=Setaria viridis TaxID=4556 RepID=UPI0014934170|nr:putative cyclin-dependent kinase F-2 [Setaria viridis]